jgi:hypothetical protein
MLMRLLRELLSRPITTSTVLYPVQDKHFDGKCFCYGRYNKHERVWWVAGPEG